MVCMKCGQEVDAGQVFCQACLENMDQYPVKPDVVIQLPHQRPAELPKKPAPRRRILSDQEQLQRLTFQNRLLRWFLAIAVVCVCLLAFGVGLLLQKLEIVQNLGRNYSTAETTAPTVSTTSPVTEPAASPFPVA